VVREGSRRTKEWISWREIIVVGFGNPRTIIPIPVLACCCCEGCYVDSRSHFYIGVESLLEGTSPLPTILTLVQMSACSSSPEICEVKSRKKSKPYIKTTSKTAGFKSRLNEFSCVLTSYSTSMNAMIFSPFTGAGHHRLQTYSSSRQHFIGQKNYTCATKTHVVP